jgi:hypothetical protein
MDRDERKGTKISINFFACYRVIQKEVYTFKNLFYKNY